MVNATNWLCMPQKEVRRFIDNLRVYVRGGAGGQGLPKYGGIGGRGGNVFIVASKDATLKQLRSHFPTKRFVAASGENSSTRALQGPAGSNFEIAVPRGISVKTDAGDVLGELNDVGEKVLVAKGGHGGSPLNNFQGEKGESHVVNLDLKLIADIGLVGFPNAGKSTLLQAMSRATPKIASYPFTTIQPQLGIMDYEDRRQISIADLPGLIEGAHINVGMGHKFLKHIERTKMLMFVVDIHGFRLSVQHELRTALENVVLLNKELELYKEDLVNKPAVLVLNKVDIEGSDTVLEQVLHQVNNMQDSLGDVNKEFIPKTLMRFDDIIAISAKKKLNTDYLKVRLRQLLDLYADLESKSDLDRPMSQIESSLLEHHGRTGTGV